MPVGFRPILMSFLSFLSQKYTLDNFQYQRLFSPYSGWAILGLLTDWGGDFLAPLPKIRHTNPKMMKLGTVIPYLKKIQKIYESRDTSPEFC